MCQWMELVYKWIHIYIHTLDFDNIQTSCVVFFFFLFFYLRKNHSKHNVVSLPVIHNTIWDRSSLPLILVFPVRDPFWFQFLSDAQEVIRIRIAKPEFMYHITLNGMWLKSRYFVLSNLCKQKHVAHCVYITKNYK
jgi:hypothetical protein